MNRFCSTLLTVFVSWGGFVRAANHIEYGTSISSSYGARDVVINPAALAYQTELNGLQLQTAFSYGPNKLSTDDFSLAIAMGYLGFSAQALNRTPGATNRYGFGLGIPLGPWLYLGSRFSFTRSDVPSLSHVNSFDMGLQYRPSLTYSVGLLANSLNRPQVESIETPTQWILSTTVKPLSWLQFHLDVESPSSSFFRNFGYQWGIRVEPLRGIALTGGYHNEHQYQMGLQFNLAFASFFSVAQPSSSMNAAVLGTQLSSLPARSLMPIRTALKVEIDRSLSEEGSKGSLFADPQPSFLELLSTLEGARLHPHVKLIVFRLSDFPLGLACAEDLFHSLLKLREAGKRVEVFLGNAGLKEYLIASAADRIVLSPSGTLTLLGLRAERYFFKGTLDKLGVEGELLAKGKYKSAPEIFLRTESSPTSREATLSELKNANEAVVRLLGTVRKIDSTRWNRILAHALWSADDALKEGLIDGIETYQKEIETVLGGHWVRVDLKERKEDLAIPMRIAVVIASGDILQNRVRFLSIGGRNQVTPEKLDKHLQAALNDSLTIGIVLRVSSPGGEVLASQELAGLVEQARRKKPVVVSMGDTAASGGYFMAAPAERIFAESLSLTGSIGVFLGKFNLGKLYKKIELNKEILTTAPYADLFSEDRPLTNQAKEILLRRLDSYYDHFISFVALHRNLTKDEVDKVAQGRVWLGSEAITHRLVDERGGYLDSIGYIAKKSGLGGFPYDVWSPSLTSSLFDVFNPNWIVRNEAVISILPSELFREFQWATVTRESPYLYLSEVESLN